MRRILLEPASFFPQVRKANKKNERNCQGKLNRKMESFGRYLKGLREDKGKTVEQIAESTKIAVANLESLERDRFDLLPPRVFVKGFIRSYIQELGLNADEAIDRFEEFSKQGELPDYGSEDHPVFHAKPANRSFISSPVFTIILTAAGAVSLAILLLTAGSRLFFNFDLHTTSGGPSVNTVQPVSRTSNGVSDTFVSTDSNRPSSGKRTLEIRALDSTWIRIEPDSGPAEELMMSAGDVQVFTAKRSFYLQTGNAGGIRLTFDGKTLPVLGKAKQTLSLTLD
jgi:cytoskeleton protein RodZ